MPLSIDQAEGYLQKAVGSPCCPCLQDGCAVLGFIKLLLAAAIKLPLLRHRPVCCAECEEEDLDTLELHHADYDGHCCPVRTRMPWWCGDWGLETPGYPISSHSQCLGYAAVILYGLESITLVKAQS